jgi:trans-aconitate methyltransferase
MGTTTGSTPRQPGGAPSSTVTTQSAQPVPRAVLGALDADDADDFRAAYSHLVNEAYPPQPWGTVLPFRRIFAVGRVR